MCCICILETITMHMSSTSESTSSTSFASESTSFITSSAVEGEFSS